MRGAKKAGALGFLFGRNQPPRPASRSEIEVPMQISLPTDVKRVGHISYRAATGVFSGLDEPLVLFFGVPMTAQPRVEVDGYVERIPSILVLLAKELIRREGLTAEGIFRVPAETTSMERSRAVLNMGKGLDAIANEEGPHLLASLIKNWFRSLPEKETVLSNISGSDLTALSKDGVEAEAVYEQVLQALSEPNRSLFAWLVDLLAVVCAHSDVNRMSPSALATVFSPTLRNVDVAVESFTLIQDVSKIIEKCIIAASRKSDIVAKEKSFA